MAKKILIVEDDEVLRGLVVQKISSEGYTILQAVDGEAGFNSIKDDRPDLVLLDILLPKMNGFEVLEKVKADESLKNIPVMILSNLWQKDDIAKGMKLGATDYLIKVNFASGEIIEKINNVLK